jgi:hypothetical protein
LLFQALAAGVTDDSLKDDDIPEEPTPIHTGERTYPTSRCCDAPIHMSDFGGHRSPQITGFGEEKQAGVMVYGSGSDDFFPYDWAHTIDAECRECGQVVAETVRGLYHHLATGEIRPLEGETVPSEGLPSVLDQ